MLNIQRYKILNYLLLIILSVFSSRTIFAYDRPGNLPQCIYKMDHGEVAKTSAIIEADGYYNEYNNNKNRYDADSLGKYDKWYDTKISLYKGQNFNIKVGGAVSRTFNTLIDFNPKIGPPKDTGLKFTNGDSIELTISEKTASGNVALNYVNQGCDIFALTCSNDPAHQCSCLVVKNICEKSPYESRECRNGSTLYGSWSMKGSGLQIFLGSSLINDFNKDFDLKSQFKTNLGDGGFTENGFYIHNLNTGGNLIFQALDGCGASSNYSCFNNNLGNYSFNVTKFFDEVANANTSVNHFGSIDYAIYSGDANNTNDTLDIINVTSSGDSVQDQTAKTTGTLWIKIHDEAPTNTIYDQMQYFNQNYNNSFPTAPASIKKPFGKNGRYFVTISPTSLTVNDRLSKFISSLISKVKIDTGKASLTIYNNIIKNVSFIKMVKGAIILYITIYGVMFTLGMVEITQQDLVIRIFKMGTLFALIATDSSWNFFNDYLLKGFLNGSEYLLQIVTGGDPTTPGSNLFRFIDLSIQKFFTEYTWIKLSSILLGGKIFVGAIIIAIALIYGIVIYMLCIIEVIIGYMVSIVAIAFMISVAPLFIACLLFERTKTYFDNWVKYLFNFSIQPVMLFGTIFIIYELALISFENAIAFKVCWDNNAIPLSLDFGAFGSLDFSLAWYSPVTDPSSYNSQFNLSLAKAASDGSGFYLNITIATLIFLMLIKVLQKMLDFVPNLTSMLTETMFGVGGLTGSHSSARQTVEKAKALTGMDAKSKLDRAIGRRASSRADEMSK
ncbi:MAG: type IV secretion system protein [Alphaproteobacteria bacterium]